MLILICMLFNTHSVPDGIFLNVNFETRGPRALDPSPES